MANEQNLRPFKKGQSGNPKGKEPGTISLPALINKILDGKTTLEDAGGNAHVITKREAIWLNIIRDAVDSDEDPNVRMKAAMMIFERTDGKPVAPIELSGKNGDTLQTAIITIRIPSEPPKDD